MHKKRTRTVSQSAKLASAQARALRRENRSLKKTVDALISRVEQELSDRKHGFAIFETAVQLEETVGLRTKQLEELNKQLTHELALRQAIEAALKTAKLEADHANQVKSRFLAAASHDLRQPLSSAFLFLESLNDQELSPGNLVLVRKAKIALSSLNDLLRSLLDITKLEIGGIEPRICDFRINDVLLRISSEYTHVAVGGGLEFRCVSSSAIVRSDPRLLESVLRNFVSNAIRYTPSGKVLVGCRRRMDGLEIAVCDTGIGIPQSELENIFQAYQQCESASGRRAEAGMGLGLSIVQRIVTLLGIERRVRSEPGRGSVFSAIVPYGRRSLRSSSATEEFVNRKSLGGKVIVVVDDSRDVLDGMTSLLRKWDCVAVPARTAEEAVARLMSNELVPDLIIADYHLGDAKKGDQAIRDISREFKHVGPAFVITSNPDPALRRHLKRSGLAVLTKPLNLAKLRAMIEQKLSETDASTTAKTGPSRPVQVLQ
jgi:signal transduction histidine kinase/FixJ family two-component response regulator